MIFAIAMTNACSADSDGLNRARADASSADASLVVDASLADVSVANALAADSSTGTADQLVLPGDAYFPESLNAGADGTIYVGSLGTGQIVKFASGSSEAEMLVSPAQGRNFAGVLVDDETTTLLVCTGNIAAFAQDNVVSRFSLATGQRTASYPLPDGAFCNDLAFDGDHNVYATDSTGGRVFKLAKDAPDGTDLTPWISDPLLRAAAADGFGADGIAYDGVGNLFVNAFSDGRLVRIPIEEDGGAGAVVEITVTPALVGPDGMRALDKDTLIVAEAGDANRLSLLHINGTAAQLTVLQDELDQPASVVVVGSDAWVAEGQVARLVSMPPQTPNLPFVVRRVRIAR